MGKRAEMLTDLGVAYSTVILEFSVTLGLKTGSLELISSFLCQYRMWLTLVNVQAEI